MESTGTLHTQGLLLLHGTLRTEVCAVGIKVWGDLDWVERAFRQIDRPKPSRILGDGLQDQVGVAEA